MPLETLQENFLNETAELADNQFTFFSHHIAYLDLDECATDRWTDESMLNLYSDTIDRHPDRSYTVGTPTQVRYLGSRGLKLDITLQFASDWERDLLVAAPLFDESYDDVSGLKFFARVKPSDMITGHEVLAAHRRFNQTVVSANLGEMQVTNLSVHHELVHILVINDDII
ncbi:hypothetical protein BH10PAT4_BH10PAT4_0050 [soil metagenome]